VNTTQAEYQVYGPGFNATGRAEAVEEGITIEMTAEQYAPYSTLQDVFQYPFSGEFGNTAWIDEEPAAVEDGDRVGRMDRVRLRDGRKHECHSTST